jgi:hypothetical protein
VPCCSYNVFIILGHLVLSVVWVVVSVVSVDRSLALVDTRATGCKTQQLSLFISVVQNVDRFVH